MRRKGKNTTQQITAFTRSYSKPNITFLLTIFRPFSFQ